MAITIVGGVRVPGSSGQLTMAVNSPPVWSTAEGSLGSLFEPNTVTSSGFAVAATDPNANDTVSYSIYSGQLPHSVASGNIIFSGKPNNNDTIVVNGNTWTFVTSGATGEQSNIGDTLALTLDALVIALNASVLGSMTGATYTTDGTKMIVHHDTPGTGGNSFTLAAGTDIAVVQTASGATLTNGGGDQAVINASTGDITGDAVTIGETYTFNFTVEATDGKLITRRVFSIKVDDDADPVWTTLAGAFATNADEGVAGSTYTVVATDFDGQPQPLEYSVVAGSMPVGFDWDDVPGGPSLTGVISGTPTDGSFSDDDATAFTVRATDSLNFSDLSKTINVDCATFEDGTGTSATGRTQKDATTLANNINLIYGVGTGTSGYGQTPVSLPTNDQEVSKTDLLAWRVAINAAAEHQGTTLNPASPATTLLDDPKPWDAGTFFDTLVQNTTTGTTNITDNKANVAGASVAVTANPNSVNSVRTTAWSTTVDHEFTVTFTDQDHVRAFFNAGGQIRLSASRTGGSATTQNTNWTTLLSGAGEYIFDSADYFALTTSYVSKQNTIGTGAYAANDWDIAAKTNTVTDGTGRGGKGNILTFRSQFNDDHTASGAGPDSVDGTLTSSISMRNVDGTPLTITAPTFSTTNAL